MTKNYKDTTITDIINDAKELGNEATTFLKELVSKTYINKDGYEVEYSFIQIRKEYFEKFHKDLMPKPREHKPSMKELILAL